MEGRSGRQFQKSRGVKLRAGVEARRKVQGGNAKCEAESKDYGLGQKAESKGGRVQRLCASAKGNDTTEN